MQPYCVIFNPSARGAKARALRRNLDFLGGQPVLYSTAGPGDARALATRAVREGFQTLIAAGGDGTVNEVVNGIADVPDGWERVLLGVLPMGTVNVFARELRLPSNWRRAWEILRLAKEQRIDLGRAEFNSQGGRQRRYFIQLAGAGVDSRAIELVTWERKKRLGALAYVVAGWKALGEAHPLITVGAGSGAAPCPPKVAAASRRPLLTVAGASRIAGELILAGNGRFYGGSFSVFPNASLQDGLLDLCVIPRANRWRAVQIMLGLVTGRLHRFCSTLQLSASSFDLTSSHRVLLQLDGENVGELPTTLSIVPKCLRVIVP